MDEKNETIDIESIIAEIKEEISNKYSYQEILAFEPVEFSSSLVYLNPNSAYDEVYLEDRLTACFTDKIIPWDRDVEGSSLSTAVKKTIKKLIRFFIAPIVDDQNRFNVEVTDVLLQMKMRMDKQQQIIEALSRKVDELKSE